MIAHLPYSYFLQRLTLNDIPLIILHWLNTSSLFEVKTIKAELAIENE